MSDYSSNRRGGSQDREREDAAWRYQMARRAAAAKRFVEGGGLDRWRGVAPQVVAWAEAGVLARGERADGRVLAGARESELRAKASCLREAGYGADRFATAAMLADSHGLSPEDVRAYAATAPSRGANTPTRPGSHSHSENPAERT